MLGWENLIEQLQLLLILPKLIESLLFGLCIHRLNQKFKGTPLLKRPQLNRIMLIGILGWFVYITLDLIIYLIAPLSFNLTTPAGTYTGYRSDLLSLLIANVLRDIAMFGALTLNWSFIVTSFSIRFGEKKTYKIFRSNPIAFILILLINGILIFGDRIKVVMLDNQEVNVRASWTGLYGIFLLVIVFQFFLSIIFLIASISSAKRKYGFNSTLNKKMFYIFLGVVFMATGNLYWVLLGVFSPQYISVISIISNQVILSWIGHAFWMFSALFFYKSIIIRIDPDI